MSLITVDADKCVLCGSCLDECAFSLLEMKTGDSLPTPREIEVRSAQGLLSQVESFNPPKV